MDVVTKDGCAKISLEGDFCFSEHGVWKATTAQVLDTPRLRRIEIDLRAVPFLDSSALGMILLLKERASLKNVNLALVSPSPYVRTVLDAVHMERLVEVLD